jgi:enoyl-CoA hydratase
MANDPTVRAVVLAGDNRTFAEDADVLKLQRETGKDFALQYYQQQVVRSLCGFPKPVVAAVGGLILDSGCELVMLADIVVASRLAKFGLTELSLSLMEGDGGAKYLTPIFGRTTVMKSILCGELFGADEALEIGLISEVTEPELCLARAVQLASSIATKSTEAAQAVKASVLDGYECVVE